MAELLVTRMQDETEKHIYFTLMTTKAKVQVLDWWGEAEWKVTTMIRLSVQAMSERRKAHKLL